MLRNVLRVGAHSLATKRINRSKALSVLFIKLSRVRISSKHRGEGSLLLYLVTKNNSLSDGNKRIASFLFLWFMERNRILYNADGSKRIGNNILVALTLMIAESRTEEMETMVKVVVNLINKNN